MNEESILQTLDQAFQGLELCFQIVLQNSYLYVYINRTGDGQLDYEVLTETIYSTVTRLPIPDLQGLALYSRVLGTLEPDWESYVEVEVQDLQICI